MATKCSHCGMDSDKPDVCSWCGKDIAAKPADAKAKAPATTGAKPAGPPAPTAKSPLGRKTLPTVAEPRSAIPSWIYYVAPVALLVIALVAWSGLKAHAAQAPPPEPGAWTPIKSQNGTIAMQVPANWQWRTSGSTGTFEKVIVQGGDMCILSIEGSQGKGAMGDIAGAAARTSASADDGPPPIEKKPEGKLHTMLGDMEPKKDPNYKEEGGMQPAMIGSLPAAASNYTTVKSAGLFKVKLKGIRMTAPGGDYGWDVRILAPENSFDKFAPIAQQMIASVQFGK